MRCPVSQGHVSAVRDRARPVRHWSAGPVGGSWTSSLLTVAHDARLSLQSTSWPLPAATRKLWSRLSWPCRWTRTATSSTLPAPTLPLPKSPKTPRAQPPRPTRCPSPPASPRLRPGRGRGREDGPSPCRLHRRRLAHTESRVSQEQSSRHDYLDFKGSNFSEDYNCHRSLNSFVFLTDDT